MMYLDPVVEFGDAFSTRGQRFFAKLHNGVDLPPSVCYLELCHGG